MTLIASILSMIARGLKRLLDEASFTRAILYLLALPPFLLITIFVLYQSLDVASATIFVVLILIPASILFILSVAWQVAMFPGLVEAADELRLKPFRKGNEIWRLLEINNADPEKRLLTMRFRVITGLTRSNGALELKSRVIDTDWIPIQAKPDLFSQRLATLVDPRKALVDSLSCQGINLIDKFSQDGIGVSAMDACDEESDRLAEKLKLINEFASDINEVLAMEGGNELTVQLRRKAEVINPEVLELQRRLSSRISELAQKKAKIAELLTMPQRLRGLQSSVLDQFNDDEDSSKADLLFQDVKYLEDAYEELLSESPYL